MLLERLSRTPDLLSLAESQRRLVAGLRQWVVAGRNGRPAVSALASALGSVRAAAHFHLLIEEIGAAWPDPFAVSPPCCGRLSHDEALLAEMAMLAGRGERPRFDRLLADLLAADMRDRLFLSASVLMRVIHEEPAARPRGRACRNSL